MNIHYILHQSISTTENFYIPNNDVFISIRWNKICGILQDKIGLANINAQLNALNNSEPLF